MIFALCQVKEKVLGKKNVAFIDFRYEQEKALDSSVCGVYERLVKGVKTFYNGNSTCVRVNGLMSEFEGKCRSVYGLCNVTMV